MRSSQQTQLFETKATDVGKSFISIKINDKINHVQISLLYINTQTVSHTKLHLIPKWSIKQYYSIVQQVKTITGKGSWKRKNWKFPILGKCQLNRARLALSSYPVCYWIRGESHGASPYTTSNHTKKIIKLMRCNYYLDFWRILNNDTLFSLAAIALLYIYLLSVLVLPSS